MVDVEALKSEIDKHGGVSVVSQLCGMAESTLYRKLSGDGNNFTIGEVVRLIGVLDLGMKKTTKIFLRKQSQI